MATIGFANVATQRAFDNLADKSTNKLYFVNDSQRLYKGNLDITQSVIIVDSFDIIPGNNIFDNKIYINRNTQEFRIKYGNDWIIILPEKVKLGADVNLSNADKLPTVNALLEYVESMVSSVGVTDVSYDVSTGTLSVTDDGVVTDTQFTGVAHDIDIDSSSATVRIPMYGLPSVEVDLSGLDGLRSVEYDPDYHFDDHTSGPAVVITLSRFGLPDAQYAFDPSPFIDIYHGGDTSSVLMSIDDNKYLYATVRVSNKSDNHLEIRDDGLYVDVSDKADKLAQGTYHENDVLIADSTGNISSSGSTINRSDELKDSYDSIPSDMTVLKAISWKLI